MWSGDYKIHMAHTCMHVHSLNSHTHPPLTQHVLVPEIYISVIWTQWINIFSLGCIYYHAWDGARNAVFIVHARHWNVNYFWAVALMHVHCIQMVLIGCMLYHNISGWQEEVSHSWQSLLTAVIYILFACAVLTLLLFLIYWGVGWCSVDWTRTAEWGVD